MSQQSKRFQDWVEVDCNECARYWDSSCDAVQGSQRPCNSFLATRSIIIPAKIKSLEKSFKWLTIATLLLAISQIIHIVSCVVGG